MFRSSFFDNELTTMSSSQALSLHQNDYVRIRVYNSDPNSTGGTIQTDVLYRVKAFTTYSANITPVNQGQEDSWFPTRREVNRLAAIAGGQAEKSKHSRIPKKALVLRSSYQGMARLPCYRATRPR